VRWLRMRGAEQGFDLTSARMDVEFAQSGAAGLYLSHSRLLARPLLPVS
jgi:hypothetical protein